MPQLFKHVALLPLFKLDKSKGRWLCDWRGAVSLILFRFCHHISWICVCHVENAISIFPCLHRVHTLQMYSAKWRYLAWNISPRANWNVLPFAAHLAAQCTQWANSNIFQLAQGEIFHAHICIPNFPTSSLSSTTEMITRKGFENPRWNYRW